jgi:hypothetical protein
VQIDPDALPDDPVVLQRMLRELHAENDKLRLLIQRLTRHQFGRRSEQLSAEQLQLGLEDLEQTAAENQARQDAAEPASGRKPKPRADPIARRATSVRCRRICRATRWWSTSSPRRAPAAAALCTASARSGLSNSTSCPRSCACASRAARAMRAAPARASWWPPKLRHGRSTAACRPRP